jgi:hypothetical protein
VTKSPMSNLAVRPGRDVKSGVKQLPKAAWVAARVIAADSGWAFIAVPALLFAFAIQGSASVHISFSRSGVFVLAPQRPWRGLARLIGTLALILLPAVITSGLSTLWPVAVILWLALATTGLSLIVLSAILISSFMLIVLGGCLASPIGRDTPPGPKVILSALGQVKWTGSSIIPEVRAAIRKLQPGTVVVATARTEQLAQRYARLGFARGQARRVYLVVS